MIIQPSEHPGAGGVVKSPGVVTWHLYRTKLNICV